MSSAREFQFTLPRGERLPTTTSDTTRTMFQFTLPRGERLIPKFNRIREICSFNSRSREGSDDRTERVILVRRCFNSRSREGSDTTVDFQHIFHLAFQFTLPRGERLMSVRPVERPCRFQFTLPRGERQRTTVSISTERSFNSRSREGSD